MKLLVMVALAGVLTTQVFATKCMPLTQSGLEFPNIFKGLTQFTMHTEVDVIDSSFTYGKTTIDNSKQTAYFKEYYTDVADDKSGRVDMYLNNMFTSVFYGQIEDKVIHNNGTTCSVTSVQDSSLVGTSGYSFWNFEVTGAYMYGPSSVWVHAFNNKHQSPQSGKPIFFKKSVIRGINVNLWKSCFNNGNLTVIYALSDPARWSDGSTEGKPKPIQVNVQGYGTQLSSFGFINETYNYVYFENTVHDESIFQMPSGVGCVGLPAARFPQFPSIFTFKAELFHKVRYGYYHQHQQFIEYATMIYDYPQKLTTIIDDKNDELLTQINDFNLGVTYEIKDSSGQDTTCQILAITDDSHLDFGLKRKVSGTAIPIIKDPKHFFALNSSFYMIGEKWTRGIRCDIFETVKFNYTDNISGSRHHKVVITYLIAEQGWHEYSEGDGKKSQSRFPVRMEMMAYDEVNKQTLNMTLNFFDFDVGNVGMSLSEIYRDVDICFDRTEQVQLTFPRVQQDTFVVMRLNDYFEQALRTSIATSNSITPLRIPNIYVDFDKQTIYATVTIASRVPSAARFTRQGLAPVPVTTTQMPSAQSESDCATTCLDDSSCKVFFTCGTGKELVCYTGQSAMVSIGTEMRPGSKCQRFGRVVNYSSRESNLTKIITDLFKNPASVNVNIKVNVPSAQKKGATTPKIFNYQAASVKFTKPTQTTSGLYSLQLAMKQKKLTQKYSDIAILTTKSAHDCMSFCKAKKNCETVSYCQDSGSCNLASTFVDHAEGTFAKYVKRDTGCDIYIKPYLRAFGKLPGRVTMEPYTKSADTASSAASCARACIDQSSFDCQTFQWCDDSSSCLLFNTSYIFKGDGGKITSAGHKQCSLYLRYQMNGFRFDGMQKISGYSGHAVMDVGLTECYQACVGDSDGTCNSFDYCVSYQKGGIKGLCIIRHQSHPPNKTLVALKTPQHCMGYQRLRTDTHIFNPHPHEKPVTGKPVKTEKLTSKPKHVGLSSGSFAGLCVGLLLVGLVIGVVILFGFNRYKERRSVPTDGMSISFSKDRASES